MNALTATELAGFQSTAEGSFFDSCKLGTATAASFGSDPGSASYSYGDEIACGFAYGGQNEVKDGSQAPIYDATLRLPIDTTIANIDRVQVTQRHGVAITPEYYTIEGKPSRGPSAIVLNLKLITGVSAL